MAGAGSYRDMVDIQANVAPTGTPTPDYSGPPLYSDVPGNLTAVSGGETFRGRQLESHIRWVFECHYLPNITPTMRLSVTGGQSSGRVLEIASVKPEDYNGRPPRVFVDCTEIPTT